MFSQLDHPAIVKLIAITLKPFAIVFEYISGGNLYDLLHTVSTAGKTGATSPRSDAVQLLPWNYSLRIIRDLASALAYLHGARIYRFYHSPELSLTDLFL